MARECDICGKKPITGWNPQSVGMNLQPMMVNRDGRMVRIKACSRCRRTAEKV